jgi:hypothetical protein
MVVANHDQQPLASAKFRAIDSLDGYQIADRRFGIAQRDRPGRLGHGGLLAVIAPDNDHSCPQVLPDDDAQHVQVKSLAGIPVWSV